jgi:vacuolar-type H+-ATPase subunit B/Vma2
VLGFARRAKGLTAEISDMTAFVEEDDMEGMLSRSEVLADDLASDAAVESVRVSAINHCPPPRLTRRNTSAA